MGKGVVKNYVIFKKGKIKYNTYIDFVELLHLLLNQSFLKHKIFC